jgi:hypothetical protein
MQMLARLLCMHRELYATMSSRSFGFVSRADIFFVTESVDTCGSDMLCVYPWVLTWCFGCVSVCVCQTQLWTFQSSYVHRLSLGLLGCWAHHLHQCALQAKNQPLRGSAAGISWQCRRYGPALVRVQPVVCTAILAVRPGSADFGMSSRAAAATQ